MNINFKVQDAKGKTSWRLVRQDATDRKYKVGSRIPGLGRVVEIEKVATVYCVDCGAETELECVCDDLNFADHCECNCHCDCASRPDAHLEVE